MSNLNRKRIFTLHTITALKNLSMKKLLQFLLVLSLPALSFHGAMAQRYLSPIFPSASVTPDVVYANNIQVLTGTPTAVDLKMEI